MPNQRVLPSENPGVEAVPTPCVITPVLLKQHSITPDEYTGIERALGRTPSLTELGIFSVMWSEHCSYKSSRVHLKRLPTKGTRTSGPGSVVQGPGENAGIIDVGDGWACAFKIESHNHPSYIEPYQGAATGVGGILRDIFTMGARPLAIMDSLRFGPLAPPEVHAAPTSSSTLAQPEFPSSTDSSQTSKGRGAASPGSRQIPDPTDYAKNHQVANGVVHGVAGYGNCFGVPNLGGETRFEPCYSGNPLLNAFALGLVRTDEIFYAKATGVGNPVFYVGAKTGRDGIHGATMASEEFTEGSEQKRPNVQMGDPFLEKLLLEACLEAMKTGAVLGIQDMGAAGLTCSTCEMGARGQLGVSIELDLVPQRETGMTSYEIMLSESQERMLLVAQKGREQEVLDVFAKWGLDCAEVGLVTADDIMRVTHHGELVAEIPNKALTDDAPVYNRPVGTWTAPVPKDPPAWVLAELQRPRDYTADLKRLLASPNICDKRYIYEQYDSMVQTNTVQGPGFEAGVIRIKGTGGAYPAAITPQGASATPTPTAAEHLASSMGLDPVAADHSILGQIVNFVTGSTPEGEATLKTGNEDAANPVVAPDATHDTSPLTASEPAIPGNVTASPADLTAEAASWLPSTSASAASPSPAPASSIASPDLGRSSAALPVTGAISSEIRPPAASNTVADPLPSTPNNRQQTTRPERGLAMALAGNGRWCYLDPKLGAMHAVAEAARKVACTGATPVAATNCLNFGNPEKPEIMAQLSLAIDGIAEACIALNTPITGGNVSLYNETRGEGIYPTPVIGVVGLLDDVTKAVPNSFQHEGDTVLFLSTIRGVGRQASRDIGASAWAQSQGWPLWGEPVVLDLEEEATLHNALQNLSARDLLCSASDISDGGFLTAVAKAALGSHLGAELNLSTRDAEPFSSSEVLFAEIGSSVVATCNPAHLDEIRSVLQQTPGAYAAPLGKVTGSSLRILINGNPSIEAPLTDLRAAYSNTLESQLAAEVVTA